MENNVKLTVEEMDKLQKDLVDNIKKELDLIGLKNNLSYYGIKTESERGIIIKIYDDKENRYNYKEVSYQFNPEIEAKYYVESALSNINNIKGEFKQYIATAEEIYTHELLKACNCKELYIIDGELHSDNSEYIVDLTSIESLEYNKVDATIKFVEDSEEVTIVNLATQTIKWIQ